MRQQEVSEITQVTALPPEHVVGRSREMCGTLTVLAGREVGAFFALTSSAMQIGRSPSAQIRLEEDGVSRNHARIVRVGDEYMLEDLGSTNGTYLGDERIAKREQLHDGARIRIGNALLRFALQDEVELEVTKRVYEASVRDGLTGTFNRRHFEERLAAEFAFAARQGTPMCALLIDIDHFKSINDRWGHQAGDLVLREIGGLLAATVRAEDLLARYGGEEFAALARGIGVADTRAFAERMRSLVERKSFLWHGERIPVTVSVGFAHNRTGAPVASPAQLIAAADSALYAAKAAGRNRVELAVSAGRYLMMQPEAQPAVAETRAGTPEQPTKPPRRD
jgi:two-component system cell cycle response regulator